MRVLAASAMQTICQCEIDAKHELHANDDDDKENEDDDDDAITSGLGSERVTCLDPPIYPKPETLHP